MDENTNHPEKNSLKDEFEPPQLNDSKAPFLENGESHVVSVEDASSAEESFTGLGKEELMKYANDPFWIRIRRILFIVFWVAWFAMLVAAVVIIVLAPKCPERPDLKWYQTDVVYQIQPKSFKDTSKKDSANAGIGDINGIASKVDYIGETLDVNVIWINSIYESGGDYDGNAVVNHKVVDETLGTIADFDSLRKTTKKKDMKLMMDFIPNHTGKKHEWFEKSEKNEDDYAGYYIWADGTGLNNSQPPNNWQTEYGTPAWTFSSTRGQWYYHSYLPEYPDLNLRNDNVVNELDNILRFWLDKGVDGFVIQGVQRLVEKNDTSETEATVGSHTTDQPENLKLVERWRGIINSYSDKPGREKALMGAVKSNGNSSAAYHSAGLHVVLTDVLMELNPSSCDMACIKDKLMEYATDGRWRGWMVDSENTSRFGSRVAKDMQKAIQALHMLLPGTAVVYYGDEIAMEDGVITTAVDPLAQLSGSGRDAYRTPMLWKNSANAGFCDADVNPWLPVNSNYKGGSVAYNSAHMVGYTILDSFKDLVQLRSKEAFEFGTMSIDIIDEILYFKREAIGFTSYMVVMNGASKTSGFQGVADEITLVYDSEGSSAIGTTLNTKDAPVGFESGEVYVFSY